MTDPHGICPGRIVRHFKKELYPDSGMLYCYRVLGFATHTETEEKLVVYEALYTNEAHGVRRGELFCRPYELFMSEVDRTKYPGIRQKYCFEVTEAAEK